MQRAKTSFEVKEAIVVGQNIHVLEAEETEPLTRLGGEPTSQRNMAPQMTETAVRTNKALQLSFDHSFLSSMVFISAFISVQGT